LLRHITDASDASKQADKLSPLLEKECKHPPQLSVGILQKRS